MIGRWRKPALAGAMSLATLAGATTFIGGWEGMRTEAYRDIVGVWTVCYGETRGVGPGDRHTKAECDAMLGQGIRQFEAALLRCLPERGTAAADSYAEMPPGMKIAVVSWSYNVGTGAACGSTLARRVREGNLEAACEQLPRWNRAGGRVVRGLTNRRGAERALCLTALKEELS